MVVSLGPGKFYGSGLPRPRFYKDDSDRVDPPVPVLDALLSWANEAHWSMGGLSFARLRLQGRIEGSVAKLRAERERSIKKQSKTSKSSAKVSKFDLPKPEISDNRKRADFISPPPAPIATKRRRYMTLVDDSDEEEETESEVRPERKMPARKLCEEFDRVSNESEKLKNGSDATPVRTRSQGLKEGKGGDGVGDAVMKVVEDVNKDLVEGKRSKKSVAKSVKRVSPRHAKAEETGSGAASVIRVSPRLAKRG